MHSQNSKRKEILVFLKDQGINFIEDFDLKKKSWLKAGGTFEVFIQPNNLIQIKQILEFLKKNETKFQVVGNLSNIIFRDGKIRTPIINLKYYDQIKIIETEKDTINIEVCSGISIFKFVNFVSNNLKISCLEGLVGIPGSLGGAIYMNASSYGSFVSEYLKEVQIINQSCELIKLKKDDLKLEWRSTIFHKMKNFVILNMIFEFPKENISTLETISNKTQKIRNHRMKFQEKKFPNLGSLFATKDLYSDISKTSITYYLLNKANRILSKIILKLFNEKILISYRKILVKIYSFFFNVTKNDSFTLSDRTINCLINKGSPNANDAIKVIRKIQKKIKYSQRLENIIVDEID